MTTTCLNCGTSNHDGAKFCKGCGQSLADVGAGAQGLEMAGLSCSACGYVNRAAVQFCAKCGVQVVHAAALPQPPTSPTSRAATVTWSERPPVGAGVVACATTDGVGSPPSHKREVPWLALGLVGITIAVAGTTAWWTLARSNSKPIPPATGMTTSTPTAGIAAPTVATPANVRTEATPAAPVARVPEQVPVNAAELVPTPAASRSTATTPPATGLAVQDVERNAAERRARAQADREKGELAAHASPTFAILTSHFLVAARPSRANAVLAFLFHFEYAT